MDINVKPLRPESKMPSKAYSADAAFDLTATSRHYDEQGNLVYGFGIAVDIPEGYAGLIFPRSSLCKYGLVLTNSVGVIDAGFHGEISAKFKPTLEYVKNHPAIVEPQVYEVGDRIAQLVILPLPKVSFTAVDNLPDSDRGANGSGSTGK